MRLRSWALPLVVAAASAACGSSGTPPEGNAATTEGVSEGNVLPDFALVGYLDNNHDGVLTPDERGPIRPSDVIAANPNAEVLLVHVAFGWCKFCWEETAGQLSMTKAYGGWFVSIQILVEDRSGTAATDAFVDEWIRLNKSAMATTLEPGGSLFHRFGRAATYLMIDPKDRKVLVVGAGPPTFRYVKDKIAQRLGPIPEGS